MSHVLVVRSFVRLLLWVGVQSTLDCSAETICWSNAQAQERKGIDWCMRDVEGEGGLE